MGFYKVHIGDEVRMQAWRNVAMAALPPGDPRVEWYSRRIKEGPSLCCESVTLLGMHRMGWVLQVRV